MITSVDDLLGKGVTRGVTSLGCSGLDGGDKLGKGVAVSITGAEDTDVGVNEVVRLGSAVAVTIGVGVATPQADKLTMIVKIKSKLDNPCDVFIARPKSN